MATAAAISLNVEDQTARTSVPPYDVPRLMYYLESMNSLGPLVPRDRSMSRAPKHLTDYANWRRLNFKDIRDLVRWCRLLAINQAPVKDFAVCEAGTEAGGGLKNGRCSFLKVSANIDVVSVGSNAIVAGSAHGIGKKCVLLYTPEWLKRSYTDPLAKVSLYHCMHCPGVERSCKCREKCDRPWASRCLILRPNEHRFKCDGCKDEVYVTGALYMCSLCPNYGLCRRCYEERNIHDLTHPFEEIGKPGAQRVFLGCRQTSGTSATPQPTPQTHCTGCQCGTESSAKAPTTEGTVITAPGTPTVPSVHSAKAPFTKGDVVTLKGLAREDMDGKEATVLNVDVINGKAQIRIDGQDKTFRVKWANIEPVEDLEELVEELE